MVRLPALIILTKELRNGGKQGSTIVPEQLSARPRGRRFDSRAEGAKGYWCAVPLGGVGVARD